MVHPFVPFPIFPPYSHWYPNRETRFPSNLQVLARLDELEVVTQPFISIWYANRFLCWIAHNWTPMGSHAHYHSCVKGLERMLNWSFANRICLLDWTRTDFERYAEFIQNPPPSWKAPGKQVRYLGSPAKDFRDWPINPNWRVFHSRRGAEPAREMDRNVWQVEIRCVSQFMDFYLKDVCATRKNVAAERLKTLEFRKQEARAEITDEIMDWILDALRSVDLSAHTVHVVSFYLIIARHSVRPLSQVLGNASAPGRIDQFSRNDQGVWHEAHPKTRDPTPLSPEFGRAFERYLNYLNIDPEGPLPASSLFARESSVDPLLGQGLLYMIRSIRERLADLAQLSDSPNIARAADDIRRLTAVMVSVRPNAKP